MISTERKIKRHIKSAQRQPVRIAVYLSREGEKNLEQLRLKFLDNQGKKPTGSQVIESLLRVAVGNEKVPYPAP